MASYQQIAAEIRARIAQGRLRPGERVPSTRAITREWGVAIATASKALAQLQAEGLVRSVVGVGTVVANPPQATVEPRRSARPAERELTRERIVRTAVAIADAEGLAALTMRRLATELDVAVMSLYRYVPGKDDLVVLMADHIFAEAPLPEPVPEGWRACVEAVARLQWAVCKRHPWMPSVMSLSRPMLVPNGMALTERNIRTFRDLGFDPQTSLYFTVALGGLFLGVGATLALEADARRETGMTSEEWMDAQEEAFVSIGAPTRFPALAEVAAIPGFDLQLDQIFELGLALMLDGIAQRIPRGPAQASPGQKSVRSSRSMPRSAS